MAHLRHRDTYTRLAAGFAIGTTAVWRYAREAVDALAALADELKTAIARASRLPYVIVDGTPIPSTAWRMRSPASRAGIIVTG